MTVSNSGLNLQKGISISDIFSENVKRWYIIAIAVFVSVIIAVIYTLGFVTPLYKSSAKVYIVNKESNNITSSDFNISHYVAFDFAEIIVDTPILKQVSSKLNNKYSAAQLKGLVSVRKPDNTRIIEIIATTPDPVDSKKIVDSICEISQTELVEIMGLDRVKIISEGEVSKRPYSPNLNLNIIFSFILAILISETVIIINFIFNNKISTPDDVEKYLDLNILATIPYNFSKSKSKQ